MQNRLVVTSNVRKFVEALDFLRARQAGVPGMGLIYGKPGLGKTTTAAWYVAQHQDVYLRAKAVWTPNWFLRELVREMGEAPARQTEELFHQTKRLIDETDKVVFLDEADHIFRSGRLLETIRDLHDITGGVFVFLGMQDSEARLKRYPYVYSRVLRVVNYQPLSVEDVALMAKTLTGLTWEADAIERLHEQTKGNARLTIMGLYRIEAAARVSKLKVVNIDAVKALRRAV